MSKKEKQPVRSQTIKTAPVKKEAIVGIFDRLEKWFAKHDRKVFYALLILSTLFSFILFDAKVSDGGDDSAYIERAWLLLNERVYPYFQGPGYPVMLSLVVKIFGLNVIALKMFSVLCHFGFVWFTYKAFVKRIPYTVTFALIAFIALNHNIQYYASQTFTETFFLFVQSLCFWMVFKIIDSIKRNETLIEEIKGNYLKWIGFGLLFVLLSISKSIAFVGIAGVVAYFILTRNYRQALCAVAAFFIIRLIYQLIVGAMFGPNDTDQMEMMLRKELYKPALGHEDFGGMVDRFFNNFNLYFSLHIYRLMNLRAEAYELKSIIPQFAFITAVLMGVFTFLSYKKNKYIFFSSIYMIVLCAGVFIGIQAQNMQDRLIIIAMPMIFLLFFYGIYELVKKYPALQTMFLVFAGFMLLYTIKISAFDKSKVKALQKNLAGDIYYGYTPDWENFLKMSKYCADSLPADVQVLSRKPSMSFLYGNGKKFVGQFITTSMDPDTVLMDWKKLDIRYVIVASLRMNPKKNNGKVINTIHRMIGPVYNKYHDKVKLVKAIGEKEKCELYEIKY